MSFMQSFFDTSISKEAENLTHWCVKCVQEIKKMIIL
jgi:hypothetical protein